MRTMAGTPWTALLLLCALGGCEDPAIQRGRSPPIVLDQTRAVVPLYRLGAGRTLRSAISRLAPRGDAALLDAVIATRNASRVAATRAVLVEQGLDPARIGVRNQADDVVIVTRTDASVASCSTAMQPPGIDGVDNSITSLGTCVQATNLAGMVDDPHDLLAPPRLEPADGAVSARAVQKLEAGEVKPPPRPSSSAGGEAGGDGGGGDAGGTAAPASGSGAQSVGAAPANPLLSAAPLSGG